MSESKKSTFSTAKSANGNGTKASPTRDVLPIPDIVRSPFTTYDAKDPDTKYPPIVPLRPPAGASNILVVLLDDVGFGASSAFGGPVNMPTAERLAKDGLKYVRFHTTALCSPTRAALLSGRNHHAVGMGGITETATAAPGYSSVRPNTCAPIADILRLNGYATAQFGKCHEVPAWETSPIGPFDRWPTGSGFQHFYGFVAGETNQYYPALWENTTPVDPPKSPQQGYHLSEDLADRAISWIRQQKALASDQPFFVYFAPGATHGPHHCPPEWRAKYQGKFDAGWDELREQTFERQKKLGIVPNEAQLTKRHAEIPAWNTMDEKLKPVLRLQMENYAGFLEHADHHLGRVIDTLDDLGILDDTLIYYIIGDNGASAEGSLQGTFNEGASVNAPDMETIDYLTSRIPEWGGPTSSPHYAVGWAHAMCTPYQWTKQVASHWGGTRNGTIVSWRGGIKSRDEVRTQFTHVIDIGPTVLEVAGIQQPTQVYGVTQEPIQGVSMRYSFDDAKASEQHDVQYFEMFGNRGIYYKGWSAVTKHRTPWAMGEAKNVSFDDDVWELYDGATDWTQARDVSKEHPEKLHELQRLFLIEAARHNVLPLDDRVWERLDPARAGRPTLQRGHSQILVPGMGRLNENTLINVMSKSFSVTAEVVIPEPDAHGVIVNQGGSGGGWTLYVHQGRLTYAYNYGSIKIYKVAAEKALSPGQHQIRMEFAYDGGGIGKGGNVTLFVEGEQVGAGRVEHTHLFSFSLDETSDVGRDTGAPVSDDYDANDNAFNGDIHWVKLDTGDDDHSHLVDPHGLLKVAMMRQ
jgi:arylsulfatase A-like enzyme